MREGKRGGGAGGRRGGGYVCVLFPALSPPALAHLRRGRWLPSSWRLQLSRRWHRPALPWRQPCAARQPGPARVEGALCTDQTGGRAAGARRGGRGGAFGGGEGGEEAGRERERGEEGCGGRGRRGWRLQKKWGEEKDKKRAGGRGWEHSKWTSLYEKEDVLERIRNAGRGVRCCGVGPAEAAERKERERERDRYRERG